MLRALWSRWLLSRSEVGSAAPSSLRVVESVPPLAFAHRRAWPSRLGSWLAGSGWRVSGFASPSSFGQSARRRAVDAARRDFAAALADVDSDAAADALDRIAATRSLHELWHVRAEVFSGVAHKHDQAEAARRLRRLDRHFPSRSRRAVARGAAPTPRA
jgi:hypothetical protein